MKLPNAALGLLIIPIIALFMGILMPALSHIRSFSDANVIDQDQHDSSTETTPNMYRFSVRGTSGIKLDMLCVYKPKEGSIKRVQKQISIPYTETKSAFKCYYWIDTLPEGESGNEGDEYQVELQSNDQVIVTCGPTKIKQANHKTYGLGDL